MGTVKPSYHHIMTIKEEEKQTVIWSEETPTYRGIMIVTDDLYNQTRDVHRKGKEKSNFKLKKHFMELDKLSREIDEILKRMDTKSKSQ